MKTKKILKPWGYELLIEKNSKYMFKLLFMKKGKRCSLQYHTKKLETIFVLSGKLNIITGKNIKTLKSKIYIKHSLLHLSQRLFIGWKQLLMYFMLSQAHLNFTMLYDYRMIIIE